MIIKEIQDFVDICRACAESSGIQRVILLFIAILAGSITLIGAVCALYKGIRAQLRNGVELADAVRTVGSLAVLLGICVFGMDVFHLPVQADADAAAAEAGRVNRAPLLLLEEDRWAELSTEARLEVVKALVDIEREELGIPEPLAVRFAELSNMRGCYNDLLNLVTIDTEHLENSPVRDVVETVCHEVFHCYEYHLVEVYEQTDTKNRGLSIFKGVEDYRREYSDYISIEEDFDSYYNQVCETDARNYAAMAVNRYCPLPEEEENKSTQN